jgi:alpha-L-arabinofuranosidase
MEGRGRAKKISGDEGFLIIFNAKDPGNLIWLNIGGWGNTRTVMELMESEAKSELGPVTEITVDTGKWYDIRVEVKGKQVKCYLDNKLIAEATT